MQKRRLVVLCGTSLLLAGMEICLQGQPEFQVVRLNSTTANVMQRIQSLAPDVIIFDEADASLSTLPSMTQLLKHNPDTLMIGLDANSDVLTIISSQRHSATNPDDVIETIQNGTNPESRKEQAIERTNASYKPDTR
jgi:DNA-binding NarL/FixJ family response regulator